MTRKILRVEGADAKEFLQGLVTNNVNGLDHGLVYTALLSPQGKYLADFFMVPDGDAILLDVAAELAPGLFQRLSMYKLRADVTLAETDLKVSRGTGPMPDGAFADPRHEDMGWRSYGDTSETDGTEWTTIRVAHCIPQTGIELTPDSFILEAGFDRLNGVDFKKGCYVGQEVTARMKHKTELRKGLRRVQLSGDAETGTAITKNGKPVGTLLTRAQDTAIAYLRFDRATGTMNAGNTTVQVIEDDS